VDPVTNKGAVVTPAVHPAAGNTALTGSLRLLPVDSALYVLFVNVFTDAAVTTAENVAGSSNSNPVPS